MHINNKKPLWYYRTGSADPVWLFSDHLGSTSKAATSSGTMSYTSLYKAWGESHYTSGTAATTYKYKGQREEASFGLYYYNARWYACPERPFDELRDRKARSEGTPTGGRSLP